ncbi:50S ribosomal protein L1 [Candidatus Portiera aleyrodidarum]|uniref:50S ribosomal protein L1 n=1 Tax=Candidatus Portiera aleyrodidarum TaxID=91844 RepID=UPI0005D88F2F|nr:50S ribosomal protein L1 [Candidatus Portiera aleyrodidarum]CEL12403.1 50S ribosomal protein L1 [Candidatus Portiera aleyrodidarum]
MRYISKRKVLINKIIETNKKYSLSEAIEILKKVTLVKFCETIDLVIKLGKNLKKNNIKLPSSLDKKIIVVLNNCDLNEKKKFLELGVYIIGINALIENIKKKEIKFNVILCDPESFEKLKKIKKILKSKGIKLKKESITKDIFKKVKEIKEGKTNYCTDKNGILNIVIGKINFSIKQIKENFYVLIKDLLNKKQGKVKGSYIKKIYISSTMGPSLIVDNKELVIKQ